MKKLLLALTLSLAFLGCGKADESIHLTVCSCGHKHECVCEAGKCECPDCPLHKPCPKCPADAVK